MDIYTVKKPIEDEYTFALYYRDTSEVSCGENRPTYEFLAYLSKTEAELMVWNNIAHDCTMGTQIGSKPKIKIKALSKRI
mgnify:FL=1